MRISPIDFFATLSLTDGFPMKRMHAFGHYLDYLPPSPNAGNLYNFFRRWNSRFESKFRTKSTKYIQPKQQFQVQIIGILTKSALLEKVPKNLGRPPPSFRQCPKKWMLFLRRPYMNGPWFGQHCKDWSSHQVVEDLSVLVEVVVLVIVGMRVVVEVLLLVVHLVIIMIMIMMMVRMIVVKMMIAGW